MTDARATIGLTGLAVMGRNLARNIARHGHTVAVHNRTTAKMTSLVEEFGRGAGGRRGLRRRREPRGLRRRRSSGPAPSSSWSRPATATDAVIEELVPLLDEGDIVVDAGNAHFADTIRREAALAEKGLHFVGIGRLRRRGRRAGRPLDHGRRLRRRPTSGSAR